MLIVLIWACAITIGVFLFKKAAGTLNPGKLNIVSLAFYFISIQTVLGAIFTSLGYRSHYTYNRLADSELFANMGVLYALVLFIGFPMVILLVQKLFKVNPELEYNEYLNKNTTLEFSVNYYHIILIGTIVCSFLLVILLKHIGYVPIIELIFNKNMDFSLERSRNVELTLFGVQYIKNILILFMIPFLSYFAFGFALISKEKKWKLLFAVLFIESIVVKTYDFSKAPVVLYFIAIVLVLIFSKGGISNKIVCILGSIGIVMLIVFYRLVGYSNSFFDIYNGILGRTIFTQFGTLCMHFEAFTDYYSYLNGRSLYPTVLKLIGMKQNEHIRSAQIVMETYNTEEFYNGNSGVMNTIFIGEAYANWGIIGIIFSIIWVATIFALIFIVFLKLKKTPITVVGFAIITQQYCTCLQGGFVDYIYNFLFLFTYLCIIGLYAYPRVLQKILKRHSLERVKE